MKKRQTRWKSSKIRKVVSKEIQDSPDNLQRAFKKIGEQIGVKQSAVSQAWYSKLRREIPQFATGSTANVLINGKNSPRKKVTLLQETFLQERVVDTKEFDGIKVVTVKRYYSN